jgi:hypothetical protein
MGIFRWGLRRNIAGAKIREIAKRRTRKCKSSTRAQLKERRVKTMKKMKQCPKRPAHNVRNVEL